ncbi:MAG: DUF3791 domain-containing protein [Peptococcaceae bacterium]|nr:DUF3791 domain-containing protein [Peptococcaceae bacterium]
MNNEQLDFAIFCIECVAEELELKGSEVYKLMVDDTDILDTYIIPYYDALHTQGREYIVRELIEVLRQESKVAI